jgi:cytochrome c-type biogenesis protein CcmI
MLSAVQEFPTDDVPVFDTGGVDAFIAVVVVLMAAMLVLFLWLLVRNLRLIRRADTAGTSVLSRAPLEQRLRELDDLHRRGVISDAEHAAARQRTLTSS